MNKKELEKIDKEIKEQNKFKDEIKEKSGLISKDNYDENSWIFTILELDKKKDKNKFIKVLCSLNESTFVNTFNAMNEYYKNQIKKEYVKIEDIPSLENIFGIIKDRIKSNNKMIKYNKEEYIKYNKQLNTTKEYDKIKNINLEIFRANYSIESYESEIKKYQGLLHQLKHDIKNLKNKNDLLFCKTKNIKIEEEFK
ncbi:MAG: hypothetical protein ACP6IY_09575 [Promethearchaeia archaeon]